jgi:hypothetical protein
VHVVIDYDDMALGDVVTMTWRGTAGAGSNTQTTRVTKLGAISFLISSAAITPNYNRTVQISYAVQRAGLPPDAPAEESLVRNLAIENLPLQTAVSFFVGGTSYYYCRSPSGSIIVPADLPVGDVIYTTPYVDPFKRASLNNVSVVPSHIQINLRGSQPRHDATLFQTSIPGVGFRLLFIDSKGIVSAKPAGPVLGNAMVLDNDGTQGAIQFVKIGPITSGVLSGGAMTDWCVGSNRLHFMSWYLSNATLWFADQ